MGSIQSTPSVVGGTVAASVVVGALFYSAQNQEPTQEQPQPSSSSSKKNKKKKKSPSSPSVDDVPEEKGIATPPALAQSANLFAPPQPQQLHDSLLSVESGNNKKKKKNKAKAEAATAGDTSAVESGVESAAADAAVSGAQSGSESTKPKKKKKTKAKSPLGQDANAGAPGIDASIMEASIMDQSGLGPWTHVQTRRGKFASNLPQLPPSPSDKHTVESSDAGVTTSVTEESQDQDDDVAHDGSESAGGGSSGKQPDNVRTLAEKMLPKPRKTGVDDMLEKSDFPTVARVMRVTSGTSSDALPEKPAGVSWGDYEDADELADGDAGDDEGWDIVTSRKPRTSRPASQHDPLTSSMTSSTSSIPGAPSKLTKHQKQNVARREAQKQAKAEAESDRLERLAKHRKEQEKARIEEQYKKNPKSKVGGGMSSSVQNGALVWE